MPEVSVVVVTWNSRNVIGPCLESLVHHPELLEVIVVDNASSDGTAALIEDQFPGVRVIRNGGNDGFGRACNQGASVAKGEYVFFLNPDTLVNAGLLRLLTGALSNDPSLAVAGPVVTQPNGRVRTAGQRYLTVGRLLLTRVIPLKRILTVRVPDGITSVDWITGAAMMVRREAFAAAGGFNERFWMYNEDMELCWRFRNAGWQVAIVPEARVVHLHSESTKRNLESAHVSDAHGFKTWLDLTGRRSQWPRARWVLATAAMVQACRAVLSRPRRCGDAKAYLRSFVRIMGIPGYESH